MREKLLAVAEEYDRLSGGMSTPEVASDPQAYRRHAQARAAIADLVACFRRYEHEEVRLTEAENILHEEDDEELRQMAEEERELLTESLAHLEASLKVLLLPNDPNDAKNTIVEIRAGTGGEEAGLFAADLFRMYSRFSETKGWQVEVLSSNPTGIGGFKEIIFKVAGESVYSQLKFEGGVHRVQRVPVTEAQGRIHTSAVTVAVLPEAKEVELVIDPDDLQYDVYRSSGPGGQSVNTTDSAVRVTHKPTGLVVTTACSESPAPAPTREGVSSAPMPKCNPFDSRRPCNSVKEVSPRFFDRVTSASVSLARSPSVRTSICSRQLRARAESSNSLSGVRSRSAVRP